VKDNAVTFELGFLELTLASKLPVWFSNFLAQSVQKADGSKSREAFTRQELRKAREIFRDQLLPMAFSGEEEIKGPKLLPFSFPLVTAHPAVPRLKRAFYFLSSARMNRDLGMKVAMYCSLLEALFSTDSNEITHKIAHRISIFLSDNVEERCGIYQRVKRAYGIRSKVVHGDALSSDAAKSITEITKDIDDTCRRLLMKILAEDSSIRQFNADKRNLDDYFLRASFGDNGHGPQRGPSAPTR
jgi:hypothetical protein